MNGGVEVVGNEGADRAGAVSLSMASLTILPWVVLSDDSMVKT